jgi:luciferase family oxidoreductase group 1
MLPHYSSLKVAEQFRVLEAIAPGRIDLGLGRAPGSDQRTAFALNPNTNNAEDFPQQVYELQAWVCGAPLDPRHPFHMIKAHPLGPTSPELWILGSSDYGAQLAAHFGLPYAFAYFFTDGHGMEDALALYRRNYKPSERFPEPRATICVWALAADSAEEARRLATSREHARILRDVGIRDALVSPEEAAAYPYSESQRAKIESMRRRAFVGTGEEVREKLTTLAGQHDLDELVVVTWTYDPEPRHRSYELLAKAFGLSVPV